MAKIHILSISKTLDSVSGSLESESAGRVSEINNTLRKEESI